MKLYLEGVGLQGPGMPDWCAAQAVLAGRADYRPAELVPAACDILPPAERRRATETVKLALAVCTEAMGRAGADPADTPSVFASSGGDGATITAILEALAVEPREVSPTRFHNSVHNAPSGYWSIATRSREASTSICAYDFSFAAGLLEAASQALSVQRAVLLTAYDLSYPPALHSVRPIHQGFGAAFVLSPRPTERSLAALSIELSRDARPESTVPEPALEMLRAGNPAARSLPLLAAVAQANARDVVIRHVAGNHLTVAVDPSSRVHA